MARRVNRAVFHQPVIVTSISVAEEDMFTVTLVGPKGTTLSLLVGAAEVHQWSHYKESRFALDVKVGPRTYRNGGTA